MTCCDACATPSPPPQVAIADAREKERRKRKAGPLLLAGLCTPPKALAPLLPIFLQGVLQVRACGQRWRVRYIDPCLPRH